MKSEAPYLQLILKNSRVTLQATTFDGSYMEMKNRRRPTRCILQRARMGTERNQVSQQAILLADKRSLDIYKKLNTTNQHKMNAIPVCKINRYFLISARNFNNNNFFQLNL
jgi:hypothetical protein